MCNVNPMPTLTAEMVEDDLKVYFKSAKVALCLSVLLTVFFTTLSIWLKYFFIIAILFLCLFIVMAFKAKGWNKKKNYYIVIDECIKKEIEDYGENQTYYNIFFKKYGKHMLNSYSGSRISSPNDFESILVGDPFYLVVINKHKRHSFIYSAKKWKLDTNGFIEKDGKYYPA